MKSRRFPAGSGVGGAGSGGGCVTAEHPGHSLPGDGGQGKPPRLRFGVPICKTGPPPSFFFILPIGRRSCVASEIRALMCFGFIPCSAKASPFLLAGGSGMYKAETIFAVQQIALLASPGCSGSRAHSPPPLPSLCRPGRVLRGQRRLPADLRQHDGQLRVLLPGGLLPQRQPAHLHPAPRRSVLGVPPAPSLPTFALP